MSFHSEKGLFFTREPDGSVTIKKTEEATDDSPVILEQTLGPDMWASIIMEMSRSEKVTHEEAVKFHS